MISLPSVIRSDLPFSLSPYTSPVLLRQIGCVPALINFHLRQEPLKHCIRVAKRCKAIVVGAELQDGNQHTH